MHTGMCAYPSSVTSLPGIPGGPGHIPVPQTPFQTLPCTEGLYKVVEGRGLMSVSGRDLDPDVLGQLDATCPFQVLEGKRFLINHAKSSTSPTQRLRWLGIEWLTADSSVTLAPDNAQHTLCQVRWAYFSQDLSCRQWEHFLGTLNFAAPVLSLGRLKHRRLMQEINLDILLFPRDRLWPIPRRFHQAPVASPMAKKWHPQSLSAMNSCSAIINNRRHRHFGRGLEIGRAHV